MPPINQAIESVTRLTQMIHEEIAKFGEQQTQYAALQSSLELLRSRYRLERSYISQFTEWYGEKNWYRRGLLVLWVASATILIGAMMSAIEAAILVSMLLYFLVTYIADNHYTTTITQDAIFARDVLAYEEQLKTLFESLNENNEKIKNLFTQLLTSSLQIGEHYACLEESNALLQDEIEKFKNTVTSLEQLTKKLMEDNALLTEVRGKTGVSLDSISKGLLSLQAAYKVVLDKHSPTPRDNLEPVRVNETEEIIARQKKLHAQYGKTLTMFADHDRSKESPSVREDLMQHSLS